MIIKTFTADSTAAALKRVRSEMGGDAVVLKTKQLTDGSGQIEITACLDKPTASQATATLNSPDPVRSQTVSRVPAAKSDVSERLRPTVAGSADIERRLDLIDRKIDRLMAARIDGPTESIEAAEVRRSLVQSGLTAQIADELISEATDDGSGSLTDDVRRLLAERIESVIVRDIKFEPGEKVLFYGPAGSGKTALLGRIAAQLVIEDHKKVKLLSLDNFKIGGMEEIHSYGDLLSTEVVDPASSETGNQFGSEIVLVDTPSITYGGDRLDSVRRQVGQLEPDHRFIVCSALHNLEDSLHFISMTEQLKPTHLAVTMLDMTKRWGTVLSLCATASLKIALVTESPGGVDMARTPGAEELATKIMGTEGCDVPA